MSNHLFYLMPAPDVFLFNASGDASIPIHQHLDPQQSLTLVHDYMIAT